MSMAFRESVMGGDYDVVIAGAGSFGVTTRVAPTVDCSEDPDAGPGAVQSFKEECDINNIMSKFQRTGALEWASQYSPEYMDVTGITFETCMATIVKAEEMFADLPSNIRDRFANSPAAFLDFLGDKENRAEAIKLGLVNPDPAPAPVPEPMRVVVVDPAK